ncbi:hypothetical protein [Hyphomicrobium sp.]|jgi:hypothetical protein|uniref:hypothetical protein n=1 Tax=Hyphomicrobium sp. TaxID=82 RepID=UPI00356463D7
MHSGISLLAVVGSALLLAGTVIAAEKSVVGIVIDFSPREAVKGKRLFSIDREGRPYAVKENEIVYEGDTINFAEGANPNDTFVEILVAADKVIKLKPPKGELPAQEWSLLQVLWPRLASAYRWINSPSSDESKLENALSRGDDNALSVLPNLRRPLVISDASDKPLWLGWSGGIPPFTLTVAAQGKQLSQTVVCANTKPAECVREATIQIGRADGDIQLALTSGDHTTWTQMVARKPIAWKADLADVAPLGKLGPFLRATDLLDRGHGEFVLESARELAPVSSSYPPARSMLNQIRDGQIP